MPSAGLEPTISELGIQRRFLCDLEGVACDKLDAMAKRCSSGEFKNHPIIRQIVARTHVGTPDDEVVAYARSRLAKGAWEKLSDKDRKAFTCEVKRVHEANRKLYRAVMR